MPEGIQELDLISSPRFFHDEKLFLRKGSRCPAWRQKPLSCALCSGIEPLLPRRPRKNGCRRNCRRYDMRARRMTLTSGSWLRSSLSLLYVHRCRRYSFGLAYSRRGVSEQTASRRPRGRSPFPCTEARVDSIRCSFDHICCRSCCCERQCPAWCDLDTSYC